MTYRIKAAWRLCSAASPAGVPKCSSSAIMRKMRSSTLLETGAVTCGFVREMIPKRMLETNFAMSINGGHSS